MLRMDERFVTSRARRRRQPSKEIEKCRARFSGRGFEMVFGSHFLAPKESRDVVADFLGRSRFAPCPSLRQPHMLSAAYGEMDEVSGDGHAELLDDGSIEITFAYHNGDEAVLKANRDTSSTAC